MSQPRPALDDLLATVRQFIDELMPTLDGETRYRAQVSSFLLSICERELGAGAAHDAADRAAWETLLKTSQDDPILLKQQLCAKIRDGGFDSDFDRVLETVLARTIADVGIVRPDHLHSAP